MLVIALVAQMPLFCLGGLEAEDNTNELLPNDQAKLTALTREINDLHQSVEAGEGQPAESLNHIEKSYKISLFGFNHSLHQHLLNPLEK